MKFSFTTLLALMQLYITIRIRYNELRADGNLSTEDVMVLLVEFGPTIENTVRQLLGEPTIEQEEQLESLAGGFSG